MFWSWLLFFWIWIFALPGKLGCSSFAALRFRPAVAMCANDQSCQQQTGWEIFSKHHVRLNTINKRARSRISRKPKVRMRSRISGRETIKNPLEPAAGLRSHRRVEVKLLSLQVLTMSQLVLNSAWWSNCISVFVQHRELQICDQRTVLCAFAHLILTHWCGGACCCSSSLRMLTTSNAGGIQSRPAGYVWNTNAETH